MDARLKLQLEPLEQRLLLDGNVLVNVVGNDVFIIGDDLSNAIALTQTPNFLVIAGAATTLNGGAGPLNIPRPIGNINLVMNQGSDDVVVDGVAIGGSISFDGDGGADDLIIADSGIGGGLSVLAGLGDDDVILDNVGVAGSVSMNMGAGDDSAIVDDSGIGGSLNVSSSHGILEFILFESGVRGNVSGGGGNGSLDMTVDSSGIGGSLSGATSRFMEFIVADSGVRNGIDVMAGNRDTEVLIALSGVGGNVNVQTQAALPGDTPLLEMIVDDVGLAGSLYASAGPGFAGLMGAVDLRARGGVDLMWQDADGAEIDTILDTVVAGGNVRASGMTGEFDADLLRVATRGSIEVYGNFLTQVDAEALIARQDINVMFGPGFLELDLDGAFAGGSMNVSGAGGIELMEIDEALVRNNMNINTDGGSAAAVVDDSRIGGNLNVTNGAGALADYQVVETIVRGNLNLSSGALSTVLDLVVAVGGNVDVQTGLGADDILMVDSLVRGRTTIRTDGGNDDIGLGNSLLNGNVLVESGSGLDEVSLAGTFADEFGSPLVFNSNVTVRLGADDDFMEIGALGGAGETAVFNGSVLFDGGTGVGDVADFDPVNTFTQVPTVINFELIV